MVAFFCWHVASVYLKLTICKAQVKNLFPNIANG